MASEQTLLITPKATLSYPHLDKPQAAQNDGEKDKYSVVLVFAPGTDLAPLKAAALAAATEKFGAAKAASMVTVGGKGSTFRNDVTGKYPEGSIYISARSEQKPGLVYLHAGPDGKPARVEEDKVREVFYAGCQVRAQLRAYGYDKKGNKGIGWAPNNIQKLGEGERLDNRMAAEDAFEADLNATPADLAGLI